MNWDEIRAGYEEGLKPAELEKKYGVKAGTIRSTASRKKWLNPNKKCNATKKKVVATKECNVASVATTELIIENDELNDKHKLFCIEFIKDFNATKAYQRAYQCSYATAMVNGHKLLRNTKIAEEVERLKSEMFYEAGIDAKAISHALFRKQVDIAFASITDYISFGRKTIQVGETERVVNFVDLKDSADVDGSLITEVKEGREGVSVKLMDRKQAFDFLFKHFDMLGDSEKKRLHEEQERNLRLEAMKLDIERKQVELEALKGGSNDKPIEILIKRKQG